ncbi:hypothetical protein [Streptomyces sp. NPDC005435]|uniref:hypothetical protein n=1 Tax=Streptomyces sp. NPDC005435 TaxID=3154464 RepID=UPI0034526D0B
MELGAAGPGVERHAAAVADAACELADAATGSTWSAGAVEDAVDAIDTLTEALAALGPEAAGTLAAVPAATAVLRRLLAGLPEDVAVMPAPRQGRPRRRGLGPGWKGMGASR